VKEIRGKVAVVTGAAMGMGYGLARLLLRDGARVVVLDIQEETLCRVFEEEAKAGTVLPLKVDIARREEVYAARERVHDQWGAVDILVNNAGVVWGEKFVDCADERIQWVMDVNYHGMVWMTKAFLPDMIEKGAGHVVNIASAAGMVGVPLMVPYCASKFAVIGFTESLRMEMKRDNLSGIHFTVVCPSYVTTGMFEGVKRPLFVPWLTTEYMVQRIYDGMRRNRPYVCEPFMVKFLPLIKALLPARWVDEINTRFGVAASMETWTGRRDEREP